MFVDPHPIVVLGLQRSGTSAVAGALARLGVNMGTSEDFFPADVHHPAGYFEQRSLTAFSQKCLTFFQMSPASPRPLPVNWLSYPQGRLLVDELRRLLVSQFSQSPLWGFKQPIAAIVWPIFEEALRAEGLTPQVVVCVRDPREVQASEATQVQVAGARQMNSLGAQAIGAWMNTTLTALHAAKGGRTCTVIPYSQFFEEPRKFLEAIVFDRPTWSPTDDQWSAALGGLDALPRHQDVGDRVATLPKLVHDLLQYCESEPRDADDLSRLSREFELWQQILAPEPLSGTKIGLAWKERGQVQSVQVPFLPTGDWQTIQFEFNAPPQTWLNGLLYNKSCRVWIRRAEFFIFEGVYPAKLTAGPGSQLYDLDGITRLDGAYESQQVNLRTPVKPGPYRLELEILMEAGGQISVDAATRLSDRLHQCAARTHALQVQRGGSR